MKIENRTQWRMDDVRKIVTAGFQANSFDGSNTKVLVKYWRGHTLGRATLDGRRMTLFLRGPSSTDLTNRAYTPGLVRQLAGTINHEIAHLRGLGHREMDLASFKTPEATKWIEGLELRLQERPIAMLVETRIRERQEHALRMLAKAERKLKIATTVYRRWKTKVAYYECRQTATKIEA